MEHMKHRMSGYKSWTRLLIPGLLVPAMLLGGCGEGGAGKQESDNLAASQGEQGGEQSVQPAAPGTDTPAVDGSTDDNNTEVSPGSATGSTDAGQASGEQAAGGGSGVGQATGGTSSSAAPVLAQRQNNALQATVQEQGSKAVVTNAEAIAVIVNKQRSLPDGYEPSDLVEPNVPFSFDGPHEKRHMRKEAAQALEELFAAAERDGIELRAVSGYRSYKRQEAIYNNNVKTKGEAYASRVSAVPGMSEHQTGLSIDVSSPSVGNALEESLGSTKEGKWLAEHGPEYGFVIRYPDGKESITGYVYEPWHIRYLGKELAQDVAKLGLTLEEYFDEDHMKL